MDQSQKLFLGAALLVLVIFLASRDRPAKIRRPPPKISFIGDAQPERSQMESDSDSQGNDQSRVKNSYEIHRRWKIPNGGWGKTIVIPESCATDSRLEDLGKVLDHNARHDRNAFIFIFSSEKAAEMYDRVSELSERELEQYESEFVGSYFKNGNTGLREMRIQAEGLHGPSRKVLF